MHKNKNLELITQNVKFRIQKFPLKTTSEAYDL